MSLSWSSLCRLCANIDNNDNVFFNKDGESKGIVQIIEKFLSICISPDDTFPLKICQECNTKMTDFNSFAAICEKVQSFYRNYVHSTNLSDAAHLLNLKSRFNLDGNVEVKLELDYDDDCDDMLDDDLDYLPLSDLKECNKVRQNNDIKPVKKKRGRPRKKLLNEEPKDEFEDDKKLFTKLEELIEGDIVDNNVIDSDLITFNKTKKNKRSIKENSTDNGAYYSNLENDLKSFSNNKLDRKLLRRKNYDIFKFSCHICRKECSNWNALKIHVKRTHQTNAKVMCVCMKYLSSRRSLLKHIAKHDPNKCFKCDSCDKIYGTKRDLENHAMYHLPKDELPFVCCKCAKRFTTARILKVHEKIHVPREERFVWPCDICGCKFSTKGAVATHKRVIHEKVKPFICDLCGNAFSTKANMEEHRVRHGDDKNFVCNECQKRFKTKGSLVRHVDTHGDTAYQCAHCPMILNSRRTLRNHMYVHDNKAKHVCPFCGKAFKRRKDIKGHLKLHTGERPYSCPWCPRTFTNGSNCRIHKRRMHPTEFEIAEATNPFAPDINTKIEPKKVIHTTIKTKSNQILNKAAEKDNDDMKNEDKDHL